MISHPRFSVEGAERLCLSQTKCSIIEEDLIMSFFFFSFRQIEEMLRGIFYRRLEVCTGPAKLRQTFNWAWPDKRKKKKTERPGPIKNKRPSPIRKEKKKKRANLTDKKKIIMDQPVR